jgi:FkbM family methyltransferase
MLGMLKKASYPVRRAIAAAICPSIACYAASGEDLLALNLISAIETDPSKIRYLDIGAAHPKQLSNTFLFYVRGASGVLVEPDPDQANRLGVVRPRDIVINAGVAFNGCERLTLTKTSNPLFNSFSRERVETIVRQSQSWEPSQRQHIVGSIEARLIPANDLLAKHFNQAPPHFLSIDAEGADFVILKSIDLRRFSPLVICIEAQASIDDHLRTLGGEYRLVFQSTDNFMFART